MYKKTLLSLAVASTIGLTGCFEDSSTTKNAGAELTIKDTTFDESVVRPDFNPFLRADSFNIPTSFDLIQVLGAGQAKTYDYTGFTTGDDPASQAINDVSGVSTTGQINIPFNGSLDRDSIVANETVHLVPLQSNPISGQLDQIQWTSNSQFIKSGADAYGTNVPNFRAEPVSLDGGTNNVLRITPLEPLEDDRKYLVVVTDGVTSDGEPVGQSQAYKTAVTAEDEDLTTPQYLTVRDVVKGAHQLANGYVGNVLGSDAGVSLAYTMTTTDTRAVMDAVASPATYLGKLGQQIVLYSALGVIEDYFEQNRETYSASDVYAALGDALSNEPQNPELAQIVGQAVGPYLNDPSIAQEIVGAVTPDLPKPGARQAEFFDARPADELAAVAASDSDELKNAAAMVKVSEGAIQLPYYLQTPGDNGAGLVDGGWEGSESVEGEIQAAINAQPEDLPAFQFPRDADGGFNVTPFMPFPQEQAKAVVPVTTFYPTDNTTCTTDGEVDHVVLFQHGITVDRSVAMIPSINLVASLVQAGAGCTVVAAIDQPLHGLTGSSEEGFGEVPGLRPLSAFSDQVSSVGFDSDAIVGERHFGYTRDNSAEGLAATEASSLSDVESGSLFLNPQDLVTARDNLRQGTLDLLNLSATARANELAFDVDSDGYNIVQGTQFHFVGHSLGGINGGVFAELSENPDLRKGWTDSAPNGLGQAGTPYAPLSSTSLMNTGGQLTKLIENSPSISSRVLPALPDQGSSNLEDYLYVFQGVVDSGDPVNYAESLGANANGLLISEVIGDLTVPNEANENPLGDALSAPLTGTEPLMALADIGTGSAPLSDGNGVSLISNTASSAKPAPAASFFASGDNPCANALHSTFVAPVTPENPNDPVCPGGSDTSAAFAEMIGEVVGNISGSGIPVTNSNVLGDSPTLEDALDQNE